MTQKASGEEEREQSGAQGRLTETKVEALTGDWPKSPRHAVEQMLKQYGPPKAPDTG